MDASISFFAHLYSRSFKKVLISPVVRFEFSDGLIMSSSMSKADIVGRILIVHEYEGSRGNILFGISNGRKECFSSQISLFRLNVPVVPEIDEKMVATSILSSTREE